LCSARVGSKYVLQQVELVGAVGRDKKQRGVEWSSWKAIPAWNALNQGQV